MLASARSSAVDPLRLLLAVFVVAIHTGFPQGVSERLNYMLLDGVYRLAVPVFALVSGYFLWPSIRSGRGFSYPKRILMLYTVWMFIYLPNYYDRLGSIKGFVRLIFFGYFHLWFLVGLAVATALLVLLDRMRISFWFIGFLALACAIIGLSAQYHVLTGSGIPVWYYRNGLFTLFPYVFLGYLFKARGIDVDRKSALVLTVIGVIALIIENTFWFEGQYVHRGVDNFLALYVAAPGIFLLALKLEGFSDGRPLAIMAAFVYFVHPWIIAVFDAIGFEGDLNAVLVILSSLGLAWALISYALGRRLLSNIT